MESEYYGGDQSGNGVGASLAGGTPGPVRECGGHRGDRPARAARRTLPGSSELTVVSRSDGGVMPGPAEGAPGRARG